MKLARSRTAVLTAAAAPQVTPKSRCEGPCAKKWPPAIANGQVTVSGIDQSMVGTVKREDGTEQLTIADWSLYRHAAGKPGELEGEDVGRVWFASSPAGKKAQPPPGSNIGGDPNDGNYGGNGG